MKHFGLLRQISNRYLFSKKSHSVINIISIISSLSISVPMAAMIILLSVHNGLSDFLIKLNSSFEPELKIKPKEGKFFELSNNDISELASLDGISAISKVIETDVLLEYKGKYSFIKARGVDSVFLNVIPISQHIVRGEWKPTEALLGLTTVYQLTQGGAIENYLTIHSPQPSGEASFIPMPLYRSHNITLSGIYSIDTETELKYIVIPISTAEELTNKSDNITSLFIKTDTTKNIKETKKNIINWIEQRQYNLSIITQQEENVTKHKVLEQEKFAVFTILTLVIIVASFTLIGAVAMLMIEKKEEAGLLNILGLRKIDTQRIFIMQGMSISSYGIALGTLLGVGISLLQQKFGFVKIDGASPLLDSYPISVSITDTIIAAITVFVLSLLIVTFTVKINKENG